MLDRSDFNIDFKMSGQKPALKNAITQILSCALQPHSDIQRLTEERKKALEMTEEYPFILLEIIESKEEAYAEKLMAATFLKNYVSDSFGTKEFVSLNPRFRKKLCLALIDLLSHEHDVIRQMVSSSLEVLVVNEYPHLFEIINNKIMSYLLSENLLQVAGAIQFMKGLGCNHRRFCGVNMYFSSEYIEPLLNVLHNEMKIAANGIADNLECSTEFPTETKVRARRKKRQFDYEKAVDEPLTEKNKFKANFFYYILDITLNSLNERFTLLGTHSNNFQFLYDILKLKEIDDKTLENYCAIFQSILSVENESDINANDLQEELHDSFPVDVRSSTISCLIQILISCKKTPVFTDTKGRISEVFQKLLSEPYSHSNNFKLRSQIIIHISNAVVSLSERALEIVTCCLPAIGQIMFNCCVEFKEIIMGHKEMPRDAQESEPNNFNELIVNILMLINNIFLRDKYSTLLTDSLNDFMYLLLILMCSDNTIEDTLFGEDEIETSPEIDYTLRGRCSHTLLVFMDKCDFEKFSSSFHHVLQKHIAEANLARPNSEVYYYRILEVLMFAVGLLSYVFEETDQNFLYYVEHWSSILMDQQAPHWLVLGRLLWLGSKFSISLAPVTLSNHMSAILSNYNSQNSSIRIACYDAMRTHLSYLKANPNRMLFSSLLPQITECLFSISLYTPEMSIMCMEGMAHLFEYSPETGARNSQRIMQVILDSLFSHISNANVIKGVKFLLSKIVINANCKEIVQNSFIPFTIKLIYKNCPSPLNLKVDLPERGFDLLNTTIKFYPENLDNNVIIQGFLAACSCILDFNDSSIIEVATIFISNILMKASFQIKTLRDIKGKILAEYVPDVLFKLLEPYPQEAVCPSKFGRLCVISIMTLPEHIQPRIEAVLKAILSALQRTEFRDPIKSYCFIFAYMFTWQTESIINFLSGIPGPDGRSALSYFLNKWQINMLRCEKFERSIITLAICKMIEYSLTQKDDRIDACTITLESPYSGECTGLEKLYLCLINMFLNELDGEYKFYQETDEFFNADVLIKNHPVCNLDLVAHIKSFIRNYNTHYYYNVVKKYIQKNEDSVHQLEKNGIKPHHI